MLNIPVFRRAVHTAEGIWISPDKALPYDTFNQYLQRLVLSDLKDFQACAFDPQRVYYASSKMVFTGGIRVLI